MNYRERIHALREDHDYTQTYIADKLNIGQRTYADYKSGKTRIPNAIGGICFHSEFFIFQAAVNRHRIAVC